MVCFNRIDSYCHTPAEIEKDNWILNDFNLKSQHNYFDQSYHKIIFAQYLARF